MSTAETLFTPWRYDYIKSDRTNEAEECFFCAAAAEPDDPERLVVHLAEHHLVMLNRHPYTNGHLMVAPRSHVAAPELAPPAARAELLPLVLLARQAVTEAYGPDGFNLGMNLGRAGGAGVPDHYHFHVVPRWQGDTNFMGVVAGVRLVPEALGASYEKLGGIFARLASGDDGGEG